MPQSFPLSFRYSHTCPLSWSVVVRFSRSRKDNAIDECAHEANVLSLSPAVRDVHHREERGEDGVGGQAALRHVRNTGRFVLPARSQIILHSLHQTLLQVCELSGPACSVEGDQCYYSSAEE